MNAMKTVLHAVATMLVMVGTFTTTGVVDAQSATDILSSQDVPIYYSSSIYQTNALMSLELVVVPPATATTTVVEGGAPSLTATPSTTTTNTATAAATTTSEGFTTSDIHMVENSISTYFHDLLINDESTLRYLDDPNNEILDVSVTMTDQTTGLVDDVAGTFIKLHSSITLLHIDEWNEPTTSDGITDFAALLTFLVDRNNTGPAYTYLDTLISTSLTAAEDTEQTSNTNTVQIRSMSFIYVGESTTIQNVTVPQSTLNEIVDMALTTQYDVNQEKRSDSEKTLIIVVTFLSLALVTVSAVLCWIGGGWLELRKQVDILIRREEEMTRMTLQQQNHHQHDLESKPTGDTEEDNSPARESQLTNPSGFLGANNPYHTSSRALGGYGVTMMTPGRNHRDDDDSHDNSGDEGEDDEGDNELALATPMSTYSDTNRGPIGIMSMRKLMPDGNALGGRMDDSDDDDDKDGSDSEGDNVLDGPSSLPSNIKQLQY